VRVGMLLSSPAGNDLMFDEDLCQQGSAFVNKIWNAYRLISGWTLSDEVAVSDSARQAIVWYRHKFQMALAELEDHYTKYRMSDALMTTYKLIWDDFCSWFLEMVKPDYGQPMAQETFQETLELLEDNLKVLHPFVPFISEEIWQDMHQRTPDQALIVAQWPEIKPYDTAVIANFELAAEVISGLRTLRKTKNIPFKEAISLTVHNAEDFSKDFDAAIAKLGHVTEITYSDQVPEGAMSFRVKSNEYFVPFSGTLDVAAERAKIQEELMYTRGFLKSVQGKLNNERFVAGAPEAVVASERKKAADALAKMETLESSLAALGNA